jgi:hypothetical protein
LNYTVAYFPEFYNDLREAFDWNEMQQPGLGNVFISCIEAELSRISRNPEFYSFHNDKIRRALINKFPFGIFFEVSENTIIVYAVYDLRRNPKSFRF